MQTDVIFGIMLSLLNKGTLSAKELAEKYDISTRTVYRYVNVLENSGVPIYSKSGKNGGICILHTYRLNNCYFTAAERVSLLGLVHLIPNDTIRKSVIEKLQNL